METVKTILVVVLLTLSAAPSPAQQIRDSRGKDFWLTFLPNDRTLSGSNPSLNIMITAQTPASGVVRATRLNGTQLNVPFTITQPNDVAMIALNPSEHELRGGRYDGSTTGDAERATQTSVHISSDVDVTVYAESRETTTTDAWLVLPTDALGTEYRVASYPSFAYVNETIQRVTEGFPSQFAAVATDNNTRIEIDLTPGRSSVDNKARLSVMLQQGEVYLVQAGITYERRDDDLTGTRVRASKPVAVICGHFRAQVPVIDPTQGTRDFLVEQVPSVDTWGKRCVIVPPMATSDQQLFGPWDHDICRIVASTDNTIVNANGTLHEMMAGGSVDVPLTEPILVNANHAVLCAVIARTANRDAGGLRNGDPFLLVVPPQEQFQNAYTVVSVEPRPLDPYFKEHWITLIVPMAAEPTLLLDGGQVTPLVPIPGTTLGYAHLSVLAGAHTITSDSAFGVYVYGYGNAESYGYTGGMSFDRLFEPTVILRTHNLIARPGKLDTLVVTVDDISDVASFSAYGADRVSFDIAWNASMFVPRNSGIMSLTGLTASISTTVRFDSLHIGDTLLSVAGYHALGTQETDSLLLTSVVWQSENSDTVNIITIRNSGFIHTEGVCDEHGGRFFDPQSSDTSNAAHLHRLQPCHDVVVYSSTGEAMLQCLMPSMQSHVVDIYNTAGQLMQQCTVPPHCLVPLPLTAAPYEPLYARPSLP